MSLTEIIEYDKDGNVERFPLFRRLFLAITIILVALLSFGIGRLSVVGKREAIRIEYDEGLMTNTQSPTSNQTSITNNQKGSQVANVLNTTQTGGEVVVSKNGSKYHYLHCAGAKQIKEENKISFNSAKEAEGAGYSLASNCKPK